MMATLKIWNVGYVRIPTSYNTKENARVEAETAEDARKLVIQALGEDAPGLNNYIVANADGVTWAHGVPPITEHLPEKINGRVLSLRG
jgi:hypothetical protein